MDSLISRQKAIDAIEHITSSMSVCVTTDECHGMKRMQRQAVIELANLPPAQPEQSESEGVTFWKKRAREYEVMLGELTTKITEGMTVDSIVINKDEIVFKGSQPERKKGEWMDDTFCSECGWTHEVESGFIGSVKQFSFCPNCGADMRGK